MDPPGAGSGIAQRLVGGQAPTAADPRATAARTALFRARTAALEDQQPEIQTLELDPELSRAAAAHAAYLVRNPEQQTRWPDAHEEYADRPGFSPAGAMAASRSVIAFRVAPEKAVQDWLGSFYHRLPLLHPGLFGIGWGEDEGVMVLDASSLVVDLWKDHEVLWPAPDALAVPRAFAPEIPNPLPGVELADLGYPITVQLFFRDQRAKVAMEMALFEGADLAPETSVPCWYLTPDAPRFANLAPENAWCLIPEKTLKARTRYTVHASWGSRTCTWASRPGADRRASRKRDEYGARVRFALGTFFTVVVVLVAAIHLYLGQRLFGRRSACRAGAGSDGERSRPRPSSCCWRSSVRASSRARRRSSTCRSSGSSPWGSCSCSCR
jgi:hypothetical protein